MGQVCPVIIGRCVKEISLLKPKIAFKWNERGIFVMGQLKILQGEGGRGEFSTFFVMLFITVNSAFRRQQLASVCVPVWFGSLFVFVTGPGVT